MTLQQVLASITLPAFRANVWQLITMCAFMSSVEISVYTTESRQRQLTVNVPFEYRPIDPLS